MIIDINTKGYETNNLFPIENWYNDDRLVIDDDSELAKKIINNYPYFDLVIEDDELMEITIYPEIGYTIDTKTIGINEIATISILLPEIITAVVDNLEYEITDGVIEYSNTVAGTYSIILKADGYKPTTIEIEVV